MSEWWLSVRLLVLQGVSRARGGRTDSKQGRRTRSQEISGVHPWRKDPSHSLSATAFASFMIGNRGAFGLAAAAICRISFRKVCGILADWADWLALTIQRAQVGTKPPVTSSERQQKDRLAVA